ncbi:MAG: hypothetical protein PHQ04_07075 [Opitutaceae bacterium]|nr:hypothetical protein [Opitutaceae bacterium]
MKILRGLSAVAMASAMMCTLLLAEEAGKGVPQAAPQKPACCQKAEQKGKKCEKRCCVTAAREGKACGKCLAKENEKQGKKK